MTSFRRFFSYSLLPIFLSSLFIVGLVALPANAEGDSSGYQPCPNQDAHDFIFLMDKSGSLERTDPGEPEWSFKNTQRIEALRKISEELSGIPDVRVGLIEFANRAQKTRELLPGELSDSHLEGAATLYTDGLGADTNYEDALNLAYDMFKKAKAEKPERCRVLLFFTDGVNDPVGDWQKNYKESINQAEEWVDSGKLQELTENLHNLEVQTIAVILLDDTNNYGLTAIDKDEAKSELLEISLEALASITGHCESRMFDKTELTQSIAQSIECESLDRNGSIVAVDNLDNLVNDLLREVNKSAKTVYGCPVLAEVNNTIYESPMPAGSFIQSIDLYAYGGKIREVQGNGNPLPGKDVGHLTLGAEHLKNLPSGWVLEIEVDQGARLSCDTEPATLVDGFTNAFLFSEGVDTGGAVSARQNGELIIDNGVYSCDGIENILDIRLSDSSALQTFSNYECNSEGVSFPWKDMPDLTEDIDIVSVSGYVVPEYKPSEWPDLPFVAIFDPELKVFSIATKPVLRCSGVVEQEIVESDFLLKSSVCTAQLDEGVNGKIRVVLEVTGKPDASEAEWGFVVEGSSSICTTNNSGEIESKKSGFCNFSLETELLPLVGSVSEFDQEATITLEWDETESGVWNFVDDHVYTINLNRDAEYRDSLNIVDCDGLTDWPGPSGKDVPEEAVESNISCKVTPPPFGSLELCTVWELESDFQWVPKPKDAEWDENSCLTVAPGDENEFIFWSEEPLENKNWDEITGVLEFSVFWEDGEIANTPELTFVFDFNKRPNEALARFLAALITILGALASYTLLYFAMRIQDRFPDSEDFYYLEHEFDISIPKDKESFLKAPQDLKDYEPSVSGLKMVSSNSSNKRRLNVGSFSLKARSPAFWNVPKLLTGGWGEIKKEGWVTEILPASSQKSGATELHLTKATLLAIKPNKPGFTSKAVVVYLVPKTAAESPTFGIEAVKNQKDSDLPNLLERISPKVHADSTDEPPHASPPTSGTDSPPPKSDNGPSAQPSPPPPESGSGPSPEPSSPPPRTIPPPPPRTAPPPRS